MATMNSKNMSLSPAASDLGLGDALNQQLSDVELERKKKLLKLANNVPGGSAADALLGQSGVGSYGA